ncbi:MAG: MBL fold metallo-hydrolase [Planctomycetota bacterium]|nr:MAG: MBL fold metallo-hydrolase [Planctomycetota bacterium]
MTRQSKSRALESTWSRRRIRVGEWTITALSDGFFRLDGGSMWGVVPATLWRQWTPPAGDNTILLALRPFLAERGADKVVIEVGIGERWEEKWRGIYHIEAGDSLPATLRACGVAPEDVTHVVASHCHWDHIGGQVIERAGELVPTFPNARHFAPRIEIEMAKRPGHARSGSYRSDDVEPVEERGLLVPYEGTQELLPGIRAHVLGGHSDGVAVITIGDEDGEAAIFWADVVPTTHHIQPPYIMAYDIDVVRSFEQRSEWLERAADRGWIGLFYHDADEAFGRIVRAGRRFAFEPVESETLAPATP